MRRRIETTENKQNKQHYPPHNSQKRTLRKRISETITEEKKKER